ncbi:integral membrane protein [Grosmannia clavigera kw1407]|uniref:Integral membrane protein n=1 Tax=Grosmannia clavigera (strain kw1407 / UAMH 11150) TaxID=655863 RepID=F0XUP7_GROCL|nr:uncharacterized protein CMQ_4717 [Grosmannia clavigera kw1407]EFW98865.1 integral membrane protein [Grosmannia clavigera kw1407]
MARWISKMLAPLALALCAATVAHAFEEKINQKDDYRQQCAGMYSRKSWGGPADPFISVVFDKYDGPVDPIVSVLIFEWKDEALIGILPDENQQKLIICEPQYVSQGHCNASDVGRFMLQPNATEASKNPIYNKAVHLKEAQPIMYEIKKTGYFCIVTAPFSASEYSAVAEFRSAYGELPATQIPKLPFYGGITISYAVVVAFWGFMYYQHRSDILAVQNYITAILIFLVAEMLMTWGFYDFMNRKGSSVGAKVMLVVVAVLNAFRNSFTFFLLLIVCMGYGVVKTSLGRTMIYVRWLAIAHFVFGLVYAITSLLVKPDDVGPYVLLIILPLAATLTAFYVWTLNSLNLTLKDLRERKQHAKESMYKKLWWCILLSIVVIFGFFFLNSFSFASARDPDFVPFHWKTRWFILDGWPNLVYFADVAWVAYVWRPSANNRRFAMSDEIAQDDDGTFEISNMDIGVPEEFDEDDEDGLGNGQRQEAGGLDRSGAAGVEEATIGSKPTAASRSVQASSSTAARDSLDGETIFAVGEDADKFSDDEEDDDEEDDSEEESGLVRNKK